MKIEPKTGTSVGPRDDTKCDRRGGIRDICQGCCSGCLTGLLINATFNYLHLELDAASEDIKRHKNVNSFQQSNLKLSV